MFIRIKEEQTLNPAIWYSKLQGNLFPYLAFSGTHYIVQTEEGGPLMGVSADHAEEVDDDLWAAANPKSQT